MDGRGSLESNAHKPCANEWRAPGYVNPKTSSQRLVRRLDHWYDAHWIPYGQVAGVRENSLTRAQRGIDHSAVER